MLWNDKCVRNSNYFFAQAVQLLHNGSIKCHYKRVLAHDYNSRKQIVTWQRQFRFTGNDTQASPAVMAQAPAAHTFNSKGIQQNSKNCGLTLVFECKNGRWIAPFEEVCPCMLVIHSWVQHLWSYICLYSLWQVFHCGLVPDCFWWERQARKQTPVLQYTNRQKRWSISSSPSPNFIFLKTMSLM